MTDAEDFIAHYGRPAEALASAPGRVNLIGDHTVPLGSGLSSSAALEVALLRGLRELFGLEFDDMALALLAHRAENGLVGAPVGVMDPLACSYCDERSALLIDARSLAIRPVPLPEALGLVVIHSGIDHRLSDSEYGARRAEFCRASARCSTPRTARCATTTRPLSRRSIGSSNSRATTAPCSARG